MYICGQKPFLTLLMTHTSSSGNWTWVTISNSILFQHLLHVIHDKWQLCIECCIKYSVSFCWCTKSIVIPQFQTMEGNWVLLKSNFVNKHLLCRLYSRNVANAKIANKANPLTMTNLSFTLPDLHSSIEPLCVRIPWQNHSQTVLYQTKHCH